MKLLAPYTCYCISVINTDILLPETRSSDIYKSKSIEALQISSIDGQYQKFGPLVVTLLTFHIMTS